MNVHSVLVGVKVKPRNVSSELCIYDSCSNGRSVQPQFQFLSVKLLRGEFQLVAACNRKSCLRKNSLISTSSRVGVDAAVVVVLLWIQNSAPTLSSCDAPRRTDVHRPDADREASYSPELLLCSIHVFIRSEKPAPFLFSQDVQSWSQLLTSEPSFSLQFPFGRTVDRVQGLAASSV